MDDDLPEAYSLLCSACYQPCSGAEAHVIPHWNPSVKRVWTTYRCDNCWRQSLADMRDAVAASAEVRASFCDFLTGRGYETDAETIRVAPADLQATYLTRLIDAIEDGRLVLDP